MAKKIAVAGATGNLGNRIVKALVAQGGVVIALARGGTDDEKLNALRKLGAEVALVDIAEVDSVSKDLAGARRSMNKNFRHSCEHLGSVHFVGVERAVAVVS